LLAPLAAVAAGILVSRLAGFESGESLLAVAAFAGLGGVACWRRSRTLAALCCLLGLCFAGALLESSHRPGPRPELDVEGREPVILSGCVVDPPATSGDRERFVLELEPGARAQVTRYLRDGESPPRLAYGQRIEIEARVRRPRNFGNPGAFDYEHYLERKNIFWTASARSGAPVTTLPGRCGSRFMGWIMALRGAALDRLEQLYSRKPYETGMMQAILIGDTAKLDRVWTEHFRSTGTFHALVISGTHVAVLAAFFLFLLRLCFVPPGAAGILTAMAAWLYALVTGWQAPCVRSAAGFTLFLIGGYFFRERRILNLLAAVALGFLLIDPEQLFDPSFQLSFLAVGFLAAFAVPLLERTSAPLVRGLEDLGDQGRDLHLESRAAQFRVEMRLLIETVRLWTRLPQPICRAAIVLPARLFLYIYELVAVSAVVQMGLALPMVMYFHRVGVSGLSANAVVVPLIGLVVPLGFVAVFTGWHWVAHAAALLLGWSRAVVDWHARFEPNWRVPTPPLWVALALSGALIAAAILQHRSRAWRCAGFGTVLTLLVVLLWHPFAPKIERGRLEMTAIDVGQGDSILVAFPDGKLMLVDGGGIPSFGRRQRSQLEIGEDVVAPYLWNRSIRRVDVMVCSHAHEDHVGGLPALLEDFHATELWTGAVPPGAQRDRLLAAAHRAGVRVVPMTGGRHFSFGGAEIEVLAPTPDYQPGTTPRNNDSLVLRVAFGEHSFLLSGDMERQVESELVASNRLRPTDVLKVPHHGSRTSSTLEFLDALRPAFAVVSAGYENSYGHPNPDVLDRFAQRRIELLRTDLNGLVSIKTDGRRLVIETGRENKGRLAEPALYRAF